MKSPVIEIVRGAIRWTSGLAVDADGSPRAYHPDSKLGLDRLADAGKDGRYWGLACNLHGIPYIQTELDRAPGFYVSTTALEDYSKDARDPARYVDAERVPYVSIARNLLARGIKMGDVAMVLFAGLAVGAIVADVGPAEEYGEGSIALASALGIPSSPRHGGIASGVTYVVFPGSKRGWPRPVEDFQHQAVDLYSQWSAAA